eukprot:m.212146 g.212146  ORF g.212146 m.212146 type:complete len:570 (-) comp15848_c0_seq7:67-1776(-)
MADVTSQFVMLLQLLSTITFVEAMMDPASTPPMGWRSWNAFLDDINQTIIEGQVDAIATGGQEGKSLVSYGYNRVGIDGGWVCQNTIGSTGCTCGGVGGSYHDKDGHPVVGLERFPDLGALVTYAHSKGVKLDWYGNSCNCANNEWKQWGVQGGNPINDVKAMAKYGFDGIKIDGCSPAHNISLWVEQLAALQGVPLLLENCGDNGVPTVPGQHVPWSVPNPENLPKSGACGFQMYRISADIAPQFNSIMANLQSSVVYRNHSRPGCWAYPDMLEVGNMATYEEDRTHFAAWCIVSSPLVLGYNVLDDSTTEKIWDIITNKEAIAVNQQWEGHPGKLSKEMSGSGTVNNSFGPNVYVTKDCNASDMTQGPWKFDNGSITITYEGKTYCMDSTQTSQLQVKACDGSAAQTFVQKPGKTSDYFAYYQGNKCIDVFDPHGNPGPQVQMYDCHLAPNELFEFKNGMNMVSAQGSCVIARAVSPRIAGSTVQLWTKPQPNNSMAVLFLSNQDNTPGYSNQTYTINSTDIGVSYTNFAVRDIYKHSDLGTFKNTFTTDAFGGHDSRFYLISNASP